MNKPKVAFICVHNACRSQIAEALGRHLAGEVFESYSAGTHIKSNINADAIRLLKQHYQIDMEKEQYPKLIKDIPSVDIVITMGCHVQCPTISCQYREDWGLLDPTNQDDDVFMDIISQIEAKVITLAKRISDKQLNIN